MQLFVQSETTDMHTKRKRNGTAVVAVVILSSKTALEETRKPCKLQDLQDLSLGLVYILQVLH